MRRYMLRALLSILVVACQHLPAAAQVSPAGGRGRTRPPQRVRIYLPVELKDGDPFDSKNPANLHPVVRNVGGAVAPLRQTLLALLAGPTAAEKSRGYSDVSFGIKLTGVRIKGGVVRADFTMPRGAAFSGDNSPFYFRDAVEFTAKQFPGVKEVVVCLDGVLDFWSESDEPPRKCPAR
jgi:hypothetical protein